MDETDLALLREEIDSIDMEIVSLLESRLLISAEIGKFKKNNSRDFFDQERHDQIMEKLALLKTNYPIEDLKAVFSIILKSINKLQLSIYSISYLYQVSNSLVFLSFICNKPVIPGITFSLLIYFDSNN